MRFSFKQGKGQPVTIRYVSIGSRHNAATQKQDPSLVSKRVALNPQPEINNMKKLAVVAMAAVLGTAFAASANAQGWERNRTTVGPNGGVWTFKGQGECYGGSCGSNQVWTGPAGNSVNRSGSSSCAGGSCSGTATWTGPRGKTVQRSRSFRRY